MLEEFHSVILLAGRLVGRIYICVNGQPNTVSQLGKQELSQFKIIKIVRPIQKIVQSLDPVNISV